MLTNWMSICLYSFLKVDVTLGGMSDPLTRLTLTCLSVCQEVAGEPLYMLYRAIKYQVDKGPVDSVTGKAKRTLNDSHLLREDIDYCAMVAVATRPGFEQREHPLTLCPSVCLSVPDANSSGEERS